MRNAERAKPVALCLAARGGDHLGADAPRELYGREAHAAGRRVDEHAIAGPDASELVQRKCGGEKHDRHRRRICEIECLRLRDHELAPGTSERGEAAVGQCHHRIARSQVGNPVAHRFNRSRAFTTERRKRRRIHPERVEHVPEVEPCCTNANDDFARARDGPLARGERQVVEHASLADFETHRRGVVRSSVSGGGGVATRASRAT